MSTRLHIVVPDELLAQVDAALGPGQPRADFIRRAVEFALVHDPLRKLPGAVEQASEVGRSETDREKRSPAPAEQPKRARNAVVPDQARSAGGARVRRSGDIERCAPIPRKGKS